MLKKIRNWKPDKIFWMGVLTYWLTTIVCVVPLNLFFDTKIDASWVMLCALCGGILAKLEDLTERVSPGALMLEELLQSMNRDLVAARKAEATEAEPVKNELHVPVFLRTPKGGK